MTAIADQIQVAGFVVLAIFGLAIIVSGLVFVTALYFYWRDELQPARKARQSRQAWRDVQRDERLARQNIVPLTCAVQRTPRRPVA